MAFPPLEILITLGNSDFLDFPTNLKWDALFHRIAYGYSSADWDGLCDHLRDVP